MAKSIFRLKARRLRKSGESVRVIAEKLGVAKSSVSLWVRDIALTDEQKERLLASEMKGVRRGQLLGGDYHRQKRLVRIKEAEAEGKKYLRILSKKELFIAGLALYWGEGSKKSTQVQFCNSDPKMIQFLLLWLNVCFDIKGDDIKCWVGINEAHKERDETVRQYWSDISGIPLVQFRKTSFKKVKNQKVYDNFEKHYGTFSINVAKPTRYYYKILGMITALQEAVISQK